MAVDLGFADDDLLIANLIAGKFGAAGKKLLPARQAMIEHFQKQGSVEALTAVLKKAYPKELLTQFNLAQPAPMGTESLFGDIPVFRPQSDRRPHSQDAGRCSSEVSVI